MLSNQIVGLEGVAPPPCGTNSFPRVFPQSAVLRGQWRRVGCLPPSGSIRVGRRRLSARAASLLGKHTDWETFLLKRPLSCERLHVSPPRIFLTQSVFQRVHHHHVDQQIPLSGSEGEDERERSLILELRRGGVTTVTLSF